jgi:hypothetical protein
VALSLGSGFTGSTTCTDYRLCYRQANESRVSTSDALTGYMAADGFVGIQQKRAAAKQIVFDQPLVQASQRGADTTATAGGYDEFVAYGCGGEI